MALTQEGSDRLTHLRYFAGGSGGHSQVTQTASAHHRLCRGHWNIDRIELVIALSGGNHPARAGNLADDLVLPPLGGNRRSRRIGISEEVLTYDAPKDSHILSPVNFLLREETPVRKRPGAPDFGQTGTLAVHSCKPAIVAGFYPAI